MRGHRVGVIGAGYVGLTTAVCLTELGNRVVCADIDQVKVRHLSQGVVLAHEPRLDELLTEGLATARLRFTTRLSDAVVNADLVFLCLPTPMAADGTPDLAALETVLGQIREVLAPQSVVVIKSTVPVGTTRRVARLLNRPDVAVVSNPEFLREGHAVDDFLHPSRVVLGADQPAAAKRVELLYAELEAPVVLTDPASAELVKYASNALLAMRLSYANSLAELCERVHADITDVVEGMRHDPRIGGSFLQPGPGWGGSCLPKDSYALLRTAEESDVDFPLVRATIHTNRRQQERMVAKVRAAATGSTSGSLHGVRLGVLGLTFKAGTDDLRDSPALVVAELLSAAGAELAAYDPCVPAAAEVSPSEMRVVDDPYLAAKDASALVLLTEWPQFRELDWGQLAQVVRRRVVVDTRNHLDPDRLRLAGFRHIQLGRAACVGATSRV